MGTPADALGGGGALRFMTAFHEDHVIMPEGTFGFNGSRQ